MKTSMMTIIFFVAFAQASASGCTLKTAQDNFSILNKVFKTYTRQINEYTRHDEKAPATLFAKHRELIDGTAAIRRLFAKEIEKNAEMNSSDEVDPLICEHYATLIARHTVAARAKPPVEVVVEKIPVCRSENMGKRFGEAVRKQRKLTIAGKITRKEQIDYLNIATQVRENAQEDFDTACQALYEYEKKLKAEKGEEKSEEKNDQ